MKKIHNKIMKINPTSNTKRIVANIICQITRNTIIAATIAISHEINFFKFHPSK